VVIAVAPVPVEVVQGGLVAHFASTAARPRMGIEVAAAERGMGWLFPEPRPDGHGAGRTPAYAGGCSPERASGHLVGVGVGWLCLAVTGLPTSSPAITAWLSGMRVVAAVLAVALTMLVLLAVWAPHAPPGATTLIVSLGIPADRRSAAHYRDGSRPGPRRRDAAEPGHRKATASDRRRLTARNSSCPATAHASDQANLCCCGHSHDGRGEVRRWRSGVTSRCPRRSSTRVKR